MDNFYPRSVFFVRDAEEALTFYTQTLGFKLDWNHKYEDRAAVFQVSLFGFELILNHGWPDIKHRVGHGRLFIGLGDGQVAPLREHILARKIKVSLDNWGNPTLVIQDLDGNEIFFWVNDQWPAMESDLAAQGLLVELHHA